MKADFGWVWDGDAAPGAYSTSTPRMLLPGTFGNGRSNTTVTLPGTGSAADAELSVSAQQAAVRRNLVNIAVLLGSEGSAAQRGA
ncbi:hypothetical protein D3C75_966300 [compost metagenome]